MFWEIVLKFVKLLAQLRKVYKQQVQKHIKITKNFPIMFLFTELHENYAKA